MDIYSQLEQPGTSKYHRMLSSKTSRSTAKMPKVNISIFDKDGKIYPYITSSTLAELIGSQETPKEVLLGIYRNMYYDKRFNSEVLISLIKNPMTPTAILHNIAIYPGTPVEVLKYLWLAVDDKDIDMLDTILSNKNMTLRVVYELLKSSSSQKKNPAPSITTSVQKQKSPNSQCRVL